MLVARRMQYFLIIFITFHKKRPLGSFTTFNQTISISMAALLYSYILTQSSMSATLGNQTNRVGVVPAAKNTTYKVIFSFLRKRSWGHRQKGARSSERQSNFPNSFD